MKWFRRKWHLSETQKRKIHHAYLDLYVGATDGRIPAGDVGAEAKKLITQIEESA